MYCWNFMILFFNLLYLCFPLTSFADVYSCGGFVKSPNIHIDYEKIQVKLLTAEGNLKYETECNPSNGYYLIPIYNKATYLIRVFAPSGWYFDPESFKVKVDGKSDPCTLNEDINFILSSFSVEGVLKSGDGGGPSGVSLTLSTLDGIIIATTKTESDGMYKFRAPPGKYMVSTADGSAQCIERSKVPIEVIASPIHVAPDLKISGHLLTTLAVSGKKALSNVVISLYSQNDVKLPYCKSDDKSVKSEKRFICVLKTDESGAARFPCLPPGRYEIIPSFSTEKAHFAFFPKFFEVEMGSRQEEVKFDMLGFNARGRVLIVNVPVDNAEILLNGVSKSKSDTSGWYTLEELQEKDYTVTAQKLHYQFDILKLSLTAENADIPQLFVKKVELCGSLDVEERKNSVTTIFITSKHNDDSQSVRTDSSGKFCKFVSPGVYIIAPSNENGVIMMPKQREVDVSKGPILDVIFTQFRANVLVKALCIAVCDDLIVELWNEKELLKSLTGTEEFRFTSVAPDAYKVRIMDAGRYCWEQSEINFSVERAHIDDLSFRQKGYKARVRLSHRAKMEWVFVANRQLAGEMDFSSGINSFCVPMAGQYILKFDACYKFEKPVYNLTTPQNTELVVSAAEFLVTAIVSSMGSLTKKSDFNLNVKGSSKISFVKATEGFSNNYLFKFYLPISESGRRITLLPQSVVYLFEPLSHEFIFGGECHENEVIFKAARGVFIEGSLFSPIEGVKIRAEHRSVPGYALETFTNLNGSYRLGPVRNLEDFDIFAEKEGYKFEKNEKDDFVPVKLSQLRIATVDAMSEEPLNDVLLSLSGVQNYRSNNIIDDTGKITFVGLHPGEYFIRPILQEYRFEPPSLTINVKEGMEETVVLRGRQFAYSVFGQVTHMAGQPVEALVVEAVSEQCSQLQEEDTTSVQGNYRIRGLRPHCVYRLKLKTQDGKVLHSYPTHYDLSVVDNHVEDINFVLINFEKTVDVIGEIDFVGLDAPSQYRISLYKRDSLVQRCSVNAPSRLFFFDSLPVDDTQYSVRFETDLGYSGEKYGSSEVSFIADSTYKIVKLRIISQQKLAEVEITIGSYLALPFFLFIAFIFFNHHKALSLAEDAFSRFAIYSVRNHSPSPGDELGDSTKKRGRSKKL